jgi:hypothetical protein
MNTYLLPHMLLALVGPNKFMSTNSKGFLVEMWLLLLKDVFTCLPFDKHHITYPFLMQFEGVL